ncbi:MAG: nitroreductase family protein [Roseburia sp.]
MNYLEAMEQRKSVRSYCNEAVEESVITQIMDSLDKGRSSMTKGKIRFEAITGYRNIKEAKKGFLFGIGKINAPAMIVGIYEEEEDLVEIVFLLEKEVLFLVEKGYGRCFLGTYDEKVLRSYCKLSEKEHIGIVLVLGKANADSRFMNGTFRNIAGSSRRKSYREILLNEEKYKEEDAIVDIVKHAIMAPSGNNCQPVRVIVQENKAVFYLKDRHFIDLGIFLSHFYLCCLENYDNVEITKIINEQELVNGMEPMAVISWRERKTCH